MTTGTEMEGLSPALGAVVVVDAAAAAAGQEDTSNSTTLSQPGALHAQRARLAGGLAPLVLAKAPPSASSPANPPSRW
jgi:hypothetical protein